MTEYEKTLRACLTILEGMHEKLDAEEFAEFEVSLYKLIGQDFGVDWRQVCDDIADFAWMMEV